MAMMAINEDLLAQPLEPVGGVRLRGSRCRHCGEVLFGKVAACDNCASAEMEDILLGDRGRLFSFTTVWHRLPGDYKGPDPFQPYSVGLVELPEGVRVLGPLLGRPPDQYAIGAEMLLVVRPLFKTADGDEVLSYAFQQAGR